MTTKVFIPTIDLSKPDSEIVQAISEACSSIGFFQIISYDEDIKANLLTKLKQEMHNFFDLPKHSKMKLKRTTENSRGYFDDELTKQKRDWKEGIDIGVPGSREWDVKDDDPRNGCMDGFNYFPANDENNNMHEFRDVVVKYFKACEILAHRLAVYMEQGLKLMKCVDDDETSENDNLVQRLKEEHMSYLRMNYYPPYKNKTDIGDSISYNGNEFDEQPLGISPHHDAGFLTILLQDDDCHSLQVALPSVTSDDDLSWITVNPTPGALTINTGVMAMIWSNGQYRAPLHRVLTNHEKERYSAPFFYNPGYRSMISPIISSLDESGNTKTKYHPCSWGYFRALRFAGDFMDIGTEIQVEDYEKERSSDYIEKQSLFLEKVNFAVPFDVETYCRWLKF